MENDLFLRRFPPARRNQSPPAIFGKHDIRIIQFDSIPEFTSHLFVSLIECLAVVSICTATHCITVAALNFLKPIGVRQSLARESDDICGVALQNLFSL